MIFPATTALYAAVLALIYVGLSFWVVGGRVSDDALFGDGEDPLRKRIRSHSNFQEYVPFALLLIGLLEASGRASHLVVEILLIVLVVARLLHPVGMFASKNSTQQFACRGGGTIATLGVIGVAAGLLLFRLT